MKLTILFSLSVLTIVLLFNSCDSLNKSDTNTEACEGYTPEFGGSEYDSLEYCPLSSGDSIENGYRIYSINLQSEKVTCFNDTILVWIRASMAQNQPRPILVRAYIEVDYIDYNYHYAEYFEPIPLQNTDELWEATGLNGSDGWKFLPKPHVDGTSSEYFSIHVDFMVPVNSDSGLDWRYLCEMCNIFLIRYSYWASNYK
jgi:hypothetical protein